MADNMRRRNTTRLKVGKDGTRRNLDRPGTFIIEGIAIAGQIIGKRYRLCCQPVLDRPPDGMTAAKAMEKNDRSIFARTRNFYIKRQVVPPIAMITFYQLSSANQTVCCRHDCLQRSPDNVGVDTN